MKIKSIAYILFFSCVLSTSAQSDTLFNSLYPVTRSNNFAESSAAFILLSKIELARSEIETLESDYESEDRKLFKMFFEYTLAIRKQEYDYIRKFIQSCKGNIKFLNENPTKIISITNPYYTYLKSLAYNDDEALSVIFELYQTADASISSSIENDLIEIKELNNNRFEAIKNKYDDVEIKR
ncbi:hypothetical protein [Vibrio nigripulchritudo]|uniref:hypothetical protein n=1 Tax=Vibrio nigripulchritudo TaxID=28173 RepID=UPI0003B203A7|nr:hypothetical protein [Vibrio nigripulchritudo]CCN70729.1 exported hypothetical protein [Vibrio nigripulchritudo SFn118]